MVDSTEHDTQRSRGIDDDQFPLGLSSRQFFVLVVVGAVVIPGLLVGVLEVAGLSMIGNFIWILGYETGIFVVWYIWLRPLDLVGAVKQDTSPDIDERTDEEENQNTPKDSNTAESTDSG